MEHVFTYPKVPILFLLYQEYTKNGKYKIYINFILFYIKHLTKKKKIVNILQAEPQQMKNIQSTTTEENERKKHREQLESRLALDILLNFQEAVKSKSFVISNSDNQGLFEYWLQCRKFYGASIIYSQNHIR